VVDSLALIPAYTEIMTLQKALLQLDSSATKIYACQTNTSLNTVIQNYAADSTKHGSAIARAVLKQVNGQPIFLPHLLPPHGGARQGATQNSNSETNELIISATNEKVRGLKVYPNPANSGFVILYNDENVSPLQYNFSDMLGKILEIGSLNRSSGREIDASNYPSGLYIVSVTNSKLVLSQQKLVIMK
jgi:hypothetical protein